MEELGWYEPVPNPVESLLAKKVRADAVGRDRLREVVLPTRASAAGLNPASPSSTPATTVGSHKAFVTYGATPVRPKEIANILG